MDRIARNAEALIAQLQAVLLMPATWLHLLMIACAFALGWAFRHLYMHSLRQWITARYVNQRIQQALITTADLSLYILPVILLGFINRLYEQYYGADAPAVIEAVVSLSLAWIVIRLLAQLIDNIVLRKSIAVIVWIIAALSILGIRAEAAAALDAMGLDIGNFRLSALTVIKGGLVLFALLYLAGFAANMLERRMRYTDGLTASARVLLGKIARVILIGFALLIGLQAAGIDLSLLAVFGGALGLGLGFGLQKGISNLFSGMLLLMDRSIEPNDIIEIPSSTGGENAFGWVQTMGARYTEIITRDNKSYLIPNEDFITQQVINWSHGNTLIRLETEFGVAYSADPHEVKRLAEEAAMTFERVVADPKPVCHLVEFGDSSLNFVLRYWITDAHKGVTNTRGAVMLALWDSFQANEIPIPYPHREVFVHYPDAG